MRAVNLIPADLQGGRRSGGRSFGAAHLTIAALALLVAMVTAYTLAGRSVADKRAELASVERQAAAAEARSTNLQKYATFSQLSQQRTQTVKSLAASRFDWSHAVSEVARVLPRDAWLSSLRATVTPDVTVDGTPDPLRGALALPAIELTGCTTSQANVARVMADLRSADGVTRVSLSSAKQSDTGAPGTSTSSTGTGSAGDESDCTQGNGNRPKFSLTLFYDAPAAPSSAAASTATGAGSTATGTTTGATTTAPASTQGG